MFGLFSKKDRKKTAIDYQLVKTDMHAHLLPGIDDGSPDMDTTIRFIRQLQAMGYSKLITTPHVYWDLYRNTPEIILGKLEEVRTALKEHNIAIELHAAAEYFLDDHFAEQLARKEPFLCVKDNLILTEFSFMHLPFSVKELIFDLQMAGYQPILAHPERYSYLYKKWDFFHELKDNGVLLQLNLLSLTGGYGERVQQIAEYLLENELYSLVGTDLHHDGHLSRLKSLEIPKKLHELLLNGSILNAKL